MSWGRQWARAREGDARARDARGGDAHFRELRLRVDHRTLLPLVHGARGRRAAAGSGGGSRTGTGNDARRETPGRQTTTRGTHPPRCAHRAVRRLRRDVGPGAGRRREAAASFFAAFFFFGGMTLSLRADAAAQAARSVVATTPPSRVERGVRRSKQRREEKLTVDRAKTFHAKSSRAGSAFGAAEKFEFRPHLSASRVERLVVDSSRRVGPRTRNVWMPSRSKNTVFARRSNSRKATRTHARRTPGRSSRFDARTPLRRRRHRPHRAAARPPPHGLTDTMNEKAASCLPSPGAFPSDAPSGSRRATTRFAPRHEHSPSRTARPRP